MLRRDTKQPTASSRLSERALPCPVARFVLVGGGGVSVGIAGLRKHAHIPFMAEGRNQPPMPPGDDIDFDK